MTDVTLFSQIILRFTLDFSLIYMNIDVCFSNKFLNIRQKRHASLSEHYLKRSLIDDFVSIDGCNASVVEGNYCPSGILAKKVRSNLCAAKAPPAPYVLSRGTPPDVFSYIHVLLSIRQSLHQHRW